MNYFKVGNVWKENRFFSSSFFFLWIWVTVEMTNRKLKGNIWRDYEEGVKKLGPMLGFLKYFRRKIWRFFAQTGAKICKNLIITLIFERNANFFAENWQKSHKNCDHDIDPVYSSFLFYLQNVSNFSPQTCPMLEVNHWHTLVQVEFEISKLKKVEFEISKDSKVEFENSKLWIEKL
jgi:hypothetical protein